MVAQSIDLISEVPIVPRCPFCGCTQFVDYANRPKEKCKKCRVHTRTRSACVLLTDLCHITAETRIAHFAPEAALARKLHALCGDNYRPFDLNNERYAFDFAVTKCDLCKDLGGIEKGGFDVVLHNHVLEHVPCNYTIVLQNLHALLKPGGYHIFSFPVGSGAYRSDLSPSMSETERKSRFGQEDHVRRFGRDDFESTVGMVFGLTNDYSMTDLVPAERLLGAGVWPERWTLEKSPMFAVRKS